MPFDLLSIGTHGHLRTTGAVELLSVGSWGKFPKLGPFEFIVGVRQLTRRSAVITTLDIESLVIRTHEVRGINFESIDLESFIQATWGFISGMLPPVVSSHILAVIRKMSPVIGRTADSDIDETINKRSS